MRITKHQLLEGLNEQLGPMGSFDPAVQLGMGLNKTNIWIEMARNHNNIWNSFAQSGYDFVEGIKNFRVPGPNTPVRWIDSGGTTPTQTPVVTKPKFQSPLYSSKSSSLFKPMTTTTKTITPQGGGYSTTYTATPSVQQRLKLTGSAESDTSLTRRERGVPLDKSSELMGSYTKDPGGKWVPYTNVVVNPNLAKDKMKASQTPFTSMYNVSTTYTGKRWVPDEEQD